MSANDKRRGFTIVELLIVIVVIGILAAITVVAYRGIQQRATTAAVNSAVDQWEKIIRMELTLQGDFASPAAGCLGRSINDFPATDEFAAGECIKGGVSELSYNESLFEDWSTDRPNGELPVTSFNILKSRGIYGQVLPASYTEGAIANLQWVPQIAGQCGRGQSLSALLEEDPLTPGALTGDACVLVIE